MKRIRIAMLLAVLLLLAAVTIASGQAYTTSFITSITYQNVGSADANIVFSFYNEGSSTPITVNRTLPAGAGSSLYVGSLSGSESLPAGFQGSAVMSSDQPIVATLVQIPQSSTVKNRPLSNGFSSGASQVLIPTVLKNTFGVNTRFSVQNVHSTDIDITVEFYPVGSATPIVVTENNIPPGAAKYFDAGQLAALGSSFNGAAVVKATESGTSNPANVVASALELSISGVSTSAYEGVNGGARTVYMPSALCNAFGGQTSYYAVQNTSLTTSTTVTVEYSNGNTDSANVGPGQKASFSGCNVNSAGFSGAAIITSSDTDIVVIGKVAGAGVYSAFLGETTGYSKLALPYVRWTSDANYNAGTRQRAYIAIQNVGDSTVSNIQVKYMNKNGEVVGIHEISSIAPGAKANSTAINATPTSGHNTSELVEFGTPDANPGGGFGGAVIIEGPSGSQLVAIVRIASKDGTQLVAEDYNGVPVP